jgi:hypothetical protein
MSLAAMPLPKTRDTVSQLLLSDTDACAALTQVSECRSRLVGLGGHG